MIWDGRRDHLERDMTPISVMTSSSVVYLSSLLVRSSIQRTEKSVMPQIRGDKKQIKMSNQRILREYLNL